MKLLRANPSLLVITLFLPLALAYWPFKVDDAYISFVYARNLVQGHGLTYNGMVVEGYSNFLWTILIAPWISLGIDPLVAARILSLLSACLILWVGQRLVRQLNPEISSVECCLALMSIALSAPFTAWTLGGLETILISLWVTLLVYWEIQNTPKSFAFSMLAALACALTRPEGAMLFPILVAHRLIYRKQPWRQILLQSLLFIVPFAAYLLWRQSFYGYWIPNTAFLKLAPQEQSFREAVEWLLSFWQLRPLFAVLVILGLAETIRKKLLLTSQWSLVVWIVLAFTFFVLYAGADWMPFHRFLVPVVPLLSLFVGRALVMFKQSWLERGILVFTVASIVLEVAFALLIYIPYTPQFGDFTDGLIRCGQWIRQNTQPHDIIAVVDAGALAYYSERPTIDIVGLNNVHIAHSPGKSDIEYVMQQNPKIVQLHVSFSEAGAVVRPARQDHTLEILDLADFSDLYEPYLEGTKDLFFPALFIRKPDR
jgi:arabinofuranosyltransferase